MYLAFNDLVNLFSDIRGIKEADHFYVMVTDNANAMETRGLFIPLNEDSGELLEAIANGAIAAIWDKEKQLPKYTPNHFPIFFTDNPINAVRELLEFYIEKIDGDKAEKMNMTNFEFLNKKLLKENKETYDIAVMLEKIAQINPKDDFERRG
jgi:UDP-N-acetylmuramyl pentapeptide synthase